MKKISVKWLENPWLQNQVDTHLIFQVFAKYIPFGFVFLAIAIENIWETTTNSSAFFALTLDNFLLFIVAFFVFLMPKLQQATFGWIITKFIQGVLAFLFLTVGSLTSWGAGRKDALPNFITGLIWLPLLEFFPKITAKQKYLTMIRIILTIPVAYWAIQSGNWHYGEPVL